MKHISFLIIGIIICLNACTLGHGKSAEEAGKASTTVERNHVKTISLRYDSFQQEIISNGKLCAMRKADMPFNISGKLKEIPVKNGSFVNKGELIAGIDDFTLHNQFEKSKQAVAKARLEMENILIGQGYDGKDTTNIPGRILNIARLKSGLNDALIDYKKAQYDLESRQLKAPFSGVISNLSAKLYQQVEPGKTFCTLINTKSFEVEFTIMESEIDQLYVNQQVSVQPFAFHEESYKGKLSQINPLVDENGLIKVKAVIQNTGGKLMEGMNVKVMIERTVKSQLVIPKSALLLRQNKQVVFTYKEGKALWNYVKTGFENSDSYTILEGLSEGDEVIVEGSLNLAHESKVEVVH
ncbi:efflux RND transporter periplasmic adaptor subunit [Marinifilum caeruleilacunae]|uniref:Efflux RND transporter periplasmic adaptor subunit n=1 Tax=Marinifilum caeruleilacunae TaxID=2499076 RepID=A0ABX1X0T2_9BACT|nr:efflux RND transporter periplasmic adaptor subunit [Marinifilum caeruleilacunae]NOU62021.1 efflux RND transporter periplasmic adaptor subunit [Marinifilum caeruleilacunae]